MSVIPLEPPDSLHLKSAQGWLELGDHVEANEELEKITSELRARPDVLELRWQIYAKAKKWDACVDIANALVLTDFNRAYGWIHRSFALHKLSRTAEAYDHLENAADLFSGNWLIRYNLACYACQLGRKREAWRWLEKAIELAGNEDLRTMALDDPDLEPLWANIEEI
jgi:tetratricopeptide (TPR) repeat protein